jgi:prevent-host-death family protein
MFYAKEDTTLVGVSELRGGLDNILEKTHRGHVIIAKRHKPVAVLMSNEEYEQNQKIVEIAEDFVLALMADTRYKNSKKEDYVDIEDLLR